MIKKFLLGFTLLLLLLPIMTFFAGKSYADVTCKNGLTGVTFNYDFTPPLSTDKTSINVTVKSNSNLPDGTYSLKVSDSRDASGRGVSGKLYDGTITSGSDLIFNNVTTDNGNFAKGHGIITLLSVTQQGSAQSRQEVCTDQFDIINPIDSTPTGNSICNISFTSDLTPDGGIFFHIGGLPGDDNGSRGMVLTPSNASGNPTGSDSQNTCATNSQLKSEQGIGFSNPNNNSWNAGYYNVKITDSCTPWGTANGASICNTPVVIQVAPDGGKLIGRAGKSCKVDSDCGSNNPNCTDPTKCYCLPDITNVDSNPDKTPAGSPVCRTPSGEEGRNPCVDKGSNQFLCQTAIGAISTDPGGFAKSVLQLFFALAGLILVFVLLSNGYKFMTSQGDEEKVKEAREGITAAIAGIILVAFSIVILQFITVDIFHLPGFGGK